MCNREMVEIKRSKIAIAEGQERDWPAVRIFLWTSPRATKLSVSVLRHEEIGQAYPYPEGRHFNFVAKYGNKIVGYIRCRIESRFIWVNNSLIAQNIFYLEDFRVLKEMQRLGLGTQLFENVLLRLKQEKISTGYLLLDSDNEKMKSLLKKFTPFYRCQKVKSISIITRSLIFTPLSGDTRMVCEIPLNVENLSNAMKEMQNIPFFFGCDIKDYARFLTEQAGLKIYGDIIRPNVPLFALWNQGSFRRLGFPTPSFLFRLQRFLWNIVTYFTSTTPLPQGMTVWSSAVLLPLRHDFVVEKYQFDIEICAAKLGCHAVDFVESRHKSIKGPSVKTSADIYQITDAASSNSADLKFEFQYFDISFL